MDLTHRFTVPTSVDETWAHFNDIASVAECFPGAVVTDATSEAFAGSVKVKLGPIALQYNGSGTFIEKDDDAHRFVVDAKGKDKRGNGTAGATVTVTMAAGGEGGSATDVEVLTDLAITGKPAQFGRGVMQDVSDKLLGKFVECLEQRLAAPSESAAEESDAAGATESADAASETGGPAEDTMRPVAGTEATRTPAAPAGAATSTSSASEDDALDLGAAVVPVLLRTYGKQLAGAGVVVTLLLLLVRRLRRRSA